MADITTRSSEKSRSSKCENRVHWIPRGWSGVVSCIAQLMVTRKKTRKEIQPCRTPDLTGRGGGGGGFGKKLGKIKLNLKF